MQNQVIAFCSAKVAELQVEVPRARFMQQEILGPHVGVYYHAAVD